MTMNTAGTVAAYLLVSFAGYMLGQLSLLLSGLIKVVKEYKRKMTFEADIAALHLEELLEEKAQYLRQKNFGSQPPYTPGGPMQ